MPAKPLHKTQNTTWKTQTVHSAGTLQVHCQVHYSTWVPARCSARRTHNKSPGPITRTRVLVPWCWCYSWSPPVSHGLVASSVISSCLIGITRSSKLGRGCGAQWRSAIGAGHDARFAAPSNPTLLIPNAASLRSRRQTREGGPVRPRQPIRSLFAPAGYLSTDNR